MMKVHPQLKIVRIKSMAPIVWLFFVLASFTDLLGGDHGSTMVITADGRFRANSSSIPAEDFHRNVMPWDDAERLWWQDLAIDFVQIRYGIDVSDLDTLKRVSFGPYSRDPRVDLRLHGTPGTGSSGTPMREGGWKLEITDPDGYDLGGEYRGTHVPYGSVAYFGFYRTMAEQEFRGVFLPGEPLVLRFETGPMATPAADGRLSLENDIIHPMLGKGDGQETRRLLNLGEDLRQARIRHVITFLKQLPETGYQLLEQALDAMGGERAFNTSRTMRLRGICYDIEDAPDPLEPQPVAEYDLNLLRDRELSRMKLDWSLMPLTAPIPPDRPFEFSMIFNGHRANASGYRDFAGTGDGVLSTTAYQAVRKYTDLGDIASFLLAISRERIHIQVFRADDRQYKGKMHPAFRVSGTALPVVVLLDPDTRLPAVLETREDDPVYGDVNVSVSFDSWKNVDAIRLPHRITYRFDSWVLATEELQEVILNQEIAPDAFDIIYEGPFVIKQARNADERAAWYLRRFFRGVESFGDFDENLHLTTLEPGLMRVDGAPHKSLLLEGDRGLILLEPALTPERSETLLNLLALHAPGKPVTHVVVTHFHPDTIGGLRPFVAAGAKVVASSETGALIQDVIMERKRTIRREARPTNPGRLNFIEAGDGFQIRDGNAHIVLRTIENPHAHGMILAWLPGYEAVFSTDLFTPNPNNPAQILPSGTPARETASTLVERLRELDLTGVRLLNGRGPDARWQDLLAAAGKQP